MRYYTDNMQLRDSRVAITPPLTLAGVDSGEGGEITKLDVSANRLLWCTSRCRCRDTGELLTEVGAEMKT